MLGIGIGLAISGARPGKPAAAWGPNDRFVRADGSDGASGQSGAPWQSIQHGWSQIGPGQTLWVLGNLAPTAFASASEGMILAGDGAPGNPKRLRAWPGTYRRKVDMAAFGFDTWGGTGVRVVSNHAVIEGLNFTNMGAPAQTGPYIDGVNWRGTHGLMENCEIGFVEGRGLTIGENAPAAFMTVRNCDIHDCYDPKTNYGNADGIQIYSNVPGNLIEGCRIWRCSDDGIDLYFATAPVTIQDNWVSRCGYAEDGVATGGDGTGIKSGQTGVAGGEHLIQHNLIFDNRKAAIDTNGSTSIQTITRNTSIDCPNGFNAWQPGVATVFQSNARRGGNDFFEAATIRRRNSFDTPPGLVPNDAWFQSLSRTGVTGTRSESGAMPVIPFGRPAAGSALIGAGHAGETIGAYGW